MCWRDRERSANLLGVEQEPTVKDIAGPKEVARLARARAAVVATATTTRSAVPPGARETAPQQHIN